MGVNLDVVERLGLGLGMILALPNSCVILHQYLTILGLYLQSINERLETISSQTPSSSNSQYSLCVYPQL